MSAEKGTYSYGETYKLSNSRSDILGMRGLVVARLVKNDGAEATSNRTSFTTPSALGDPSIGISSSSSAQASLWASWGAPSKAS